MERWDLALRTLFAEFQEAVRSRVRLGRNLRNEPTYVKKTIKGNIYWYRQSYEGDRMRQSYVGPSTPELEQKIASSRASRQQTIQLIRKNVVLERKRSAVLRRAGLPFLEARTAAVLTHFSSIGLIDEGGVLVGSLAFSAYPGMLGYLFEKESLRTLDIDVARAADYHPKEGKEIELTAVFPGTASSFKAIPALRHSQAPYSFMNQDGLRVDFLIPLVGREKNGFAMPGVAGAGAQALRMLDYLIEDPIPSVLIGPRGGITVTVPQPARFALHKLMTAARRDPGQGAKRKKDILQASQLLVACQEEQPDELRQAFRLAIKKGPGWERSLRQAFPQVTSEARVILKKSLK